MSPSMRLRNDVRTPNPRNLIHVSGTPLRAADRNRRKETTITETELEQLAETLGITVEDDHHGQLHPGDLGGYIHHNRLILLDPTLGAVNRRCTLAHELAHAIRGDIPCGNPHFDARAERAADQIAAELLISHTDYAAAEALYGAHDGAIARELGVTTHLLAVWRDTYERQRT